MACLAAGFQILTEYAYGLRSKQIAGIDRAIEFEIAVPCYVPICSTLVELWKIPNSVNLCVVKPLGGCLACTDL
jgi:hypothetical protein